MIILRLYGKYKKKFGDFLKLHVDSLPAAFRLLEANFPGQFANMIKEDAFYITRGEKVGKHLNVTEELLPLTAKEGETFHLIPKASGAASGAKKKGLGAILLGIVLLAASFFLFGGFTPGINAGLALILGGASLLLTPDVKSKEDDESKSYSFSGPINASTQGSTKALIYGRVRAGSVVGAASIRTINKK